MFLFKIFNSKFVKYCFALFIIVALITNFIFFLILSKYKDQKYNKYNTTEEHIFSIFSKLKDTYKLKDKSLAKYEDVNKRIEKLKTNYASKKPTNLSKIWHKAHSWISKNQKRIVDFSDDFGTIFYGLKYSRIIKSDLDSRGTQLKLLLTLDGNQKVIFKPQWYPKEKIIEGEIYAGKDRYGSEILAFYLSIILNKPIVPICAQRILSLSKEIIPTATNNLLKYSFRNNNRTCIYGNCYYCTKNDPVCSDKKDLLAGAVIYDIQQKLKVHKSPWQRTYKSGKKALWENNGSYCVTLKTKMSITRLLDLIDTSIFDFLLQNGDRHHYETFQNVILLLDNGKGLGNPNKHHIDVLAPFYQCCIVRKSTINQVRQTLSGNFLELLKEMPDIYDFVTEKHLHALNERLLLIMSVEEYCRIEEKIIYY